MIKNASDVKNFVVGIIFGVAIGAVTFTTVSWAQETVTVFQPKEKNGGAVAVPIPIALSPNSTRHSTTKLEAVPTDIKPYDGRRLFRVGACEVWTVNVNKKDFVFSMCGSAGPNP